MIDNKAIFGESPFRENLQGYLKAKGWTAKDLIRATSLPQSTISDLLSGKTEYPRLDLIKTMIRNTDVNPSYLLGGIGSPVRSSDLQSAENLLVVLGRLKRMVETENTKVAENILIAQLKVIDDWIISGKSPESSKAQLKKLVDQVVVEHKKASEFRAEMKEYIETLEAFLPFDKRILEDAAGVNPHPIKLEHIEEAYKILHEAARAAGADIMAISPDRFAGVLRLAVREIARAGNTEEVRRYLVREAELLLGLVKGK